MSNNTQKKLYCIVRFDGEQIRKFSSYEKVEELLATIKKYNSRKNENNLIGNIVVEKVNEEYIVKFIKYFKLGEKSTLEDIDKLTTTMNPKELLEHFGLDLRVEHDVNILYFHQTPSNENNQIKYSTRALYLPILYKDDCKYITEQYIKDCIKYYAEEKNYYFFIDIANFLNGKRYPVNDIDDFYRIINNCKAYDMDSSILYNKTVSLFNNYIKKRDKSKRVMRNEDGSDIINYRHIRDFGVFIREYGSFNSKNKNSLYYNTPDYKPVRKLK